MHLLTFLSLQSLLECVSSDITCQIVLDFTQFASTNELPVDWLNFFFELLPANLRLKVRALFILNANALTQSFLRRCLLVSSGTKRFPRYLL